MHFDSISNYYEKLVLESITKNIKVPEDVSYDDFLQDIACVALNKLPSRYIRHNVDMIFYTQSEERTEMLSKVDKTVKEAFDYVLKHNPEKN